MSKFRTRVVPNKTVALFVDGECETRYFNLMKRYNRDFKINLEPKLPNKKKLKESIKEIKKAAKDYDLVIWVVDLDKIIEDNKTSNGTNLMNDFKNFYKQALKSKNIKILVVNPCLEYWFLLHYKYTNKPYTNCGQAGSELKKVMPTYSKIEKFYMQKDIYKLLEPNLSIAIKNAQKLGCFDIDNDNKSVCEIYKLFDPEFYK
ncbi:RloB family protein [Empedobacter falsenii]